MDYKTIDGPAFKFVGLQGSTTMEDAPKNCPELWMKFHEVFPQIKSADGKFYSPCWDSGPKEFNFMTAMAVNDFDEVPKGMVSHETPAAKYAVFEHKGKAESIGKTWGWIFCEWPERSKINNELDSLEIYPADYKNDDNSTCEIWVPLK